MPFWARNTRSVPSLTPDQVAQQLQSIQFAPEHIACDVRLWDGGLTIPRLAYCRTPHDLRSAGIAIIEVPIGGSGQHAVSTMKAAGAPVVITLGGRHDWEIWRQSFQGTPRLLEAGESKKLGSYLRDYRSVLNPDAIYRAKLWGRIEPKDRQPDLLDLSYLPLVERGLGEKVAGLLENCFDHLLSELGWSYGSKTTEAMSPRHAKWLIQAPFWLLAAKILRDKQVPSFKNIDLYDFEATFGKLAKHYQSRKSEPSPVAVAKYQEKALTEVARRIDRFHSLQLISTEALGHIYESAIINKETRKRWGTHSTPVWLIDYILARLRPFIQEMDGQKRRVFEPAVGHGGFLVGALRVLDELMPASERSRRKDYLRQRLSGVDIDDFSQEVARLALTLADVPNANGWDLDCLDMYEGDELESRLSKADIVLANPPFEDFSASKRPLGSLVNKAAEVVRQTMLHLPQGGVFGFVLPQTFLSSKEGADTRRTLLRDCEVSEMTLFADKVFEFGEPESVIILGRKHLKPRPATMLYQRVREKQIALFKSSYAPSSHREVDQEEVTLREDTNCLLPELPSLWSLLSNNPKLIDAAFVGRGFSFRSTSSADFIPGTVLCSTEHFPGSCPGISSTNDARFTHLLPPKLWFNLSDEAVETARAGTLRSVPQVLLNHGRASRGEWRLMALIDMFGHAVSGQVLMIRNTKSQIPLEAWWGILNSPIANAYAFSVASTRHVLLGDIQQFPLPTNLSAESCRALAQAVTKYLKAALTHDATSKHGTLVDSDDLFHGQPNYRSLDEAQEHLKYLHWRVDAEVLRLYSLPAELERQLLDLFTGVTRKGVPFTQTEYFPAHFTDLQRLDDLLAITADWDQTSARKSELIEKKIRREATPQELEELARLKMLTEARGELFAPLPIPQLEAMKAKLKAKGQWEGES